MMVHEAKYEEKLWAGLLWCWSCAFTVNRIHERLHSCRRLVGLHFLFQLMGWRSGVRWSSVASGRCTGVAVACGGVSGCGHSGRSVAGHRGRVSRGGSVSWSRIRSAGHGSSDRGCVGGSIASRSCVAHWSADRSCVAHWSADRGRVGAGSVARHGGCIGGGGSVARPGGSIAHRGGSIARHGGSVARRGGSVPCWSTIRLRVGGRVPGRVPGGRVAPVRLTIRRTISIRHLLVAFASTHGARKKGG
jgi:hypothetical protein|mmetsp:Transcript_51764/g.85165  ORF Transcript_51764/g.85165 Transcript_51764/m.85165 type:complete len:247 (-) Transcript_51764:13-753(-)